MIQEILEKSRVHNVKVVGEDEATDRNIDIQAQVHMRMREGENPLAPSLPCTPSNQLEITVL